MIYSQIRINKTYRRQGFLWSRGPVDQSLPNPPSHWGTIQKLPNPFWGRGEVIKRLHKIKMGRGVFSKIQVKYVFKNYVIFCGGGGRLSIASYLAIRARSCYYFFGLTLTLTFTSSGPRTSSCSLKISRAVLKKFVNTKMLAIQ